LVDGHIELRESVASAGRMPPLDPANSLTRIGVGSSALRPASSSEAMRAVSRYVSLNAVSTRSPCDLHAIFRLYMADTHPLIPSSLSFCRALRLELASAADPAGCESAQRQRAAAYEAVLHQPQRAPMPLGEEVALLLAASSGLLDEVSELPLETLEPLLRGIAPYVDERDPQLLARVTQSQLLGEETAERLRTLISEYLKKK